MSKQPRALELAKAIQERSRHGHETEQAATLRRIQACENAATMLRRQHEVIAELVAAFGRLEAAYVVSHSAQQRFDVWQQARAARANAEQLQGETE